jgi:hypothetical protein
MPSRYRPTASLPSMPSDTRERVSVDPLGRQMELVLVVRLNPGGGQAWYWRQDLLEIPPNGGGSRLAGNVLTPTGPNNVPDVPVRLCRPADQHRDSQASGEQ